ncbi:MAG: DUF6231 family protein [Gammaproteobacteria bacterium]|nr:DUF6231 family protein [Gammaproteobacteria bacterium]
MTACSELSTLVSPLVKQFNPNSVLLVGEVAMSCFKQHQDIRSHHLTTPYTLEHLAKIPPIELAIVSEITDLLPKTTATKFLGMIRNYHASHIIVISKIAQGTNDGWQLADFLAMGMKHIANTTEHQLFSYAIESYQPKHDWLNSRFWANPENYDKYRW